MAEGPKQVLGRRGFIAGVSGSLGALALGGQGSAEQVKEVAPRPAAAVPLLKRRLGRTGLEVPVVSMGVMNASAHALVARSYERGIRLFDTAWYYQRGMNERMVGDVIQQLGCRDEVAIATKVFLKETQRDVYAPAVKDLFLQRFAQSLERLKTDHVDILYYHAASEVREVDNPPILDALAELKKAGQVRFCGVSFHGDQAAMLDEMRRGRFFDVALVIFNAAMGHPEIAHGDEPRLIQAFEAAADSGIGLVAMKTQCGGGGGWAQRPTGNPELKDLDHGALLKWVLRHPFITTAVPGYTTFEQMEVDLAAGRDLEYTPAEKAFLQRERIRLAESFCIQCRQCRGQCPRGVDVPSLMRTHMYAYGYRNLELALATHATIPERVSLAACADCPGCTVRCPRRIDVGSRLAALDALVGLQVRRS